MHLASESALKARPQITARHPGPLERKMDVIAQFRAQLSAAVDAGM